jgi:hypothetical protein
MKMLRVEKIEIWAHDLETGLNYGPEYVSNHLANAAFDETHPMHRRFEWFLWGKEKEKGK